MHSTIFAVLAVAGLSSAAALPYTAECAGSGAYYVCANNNFRGYCSVDPCAIKWCPDFYDQTCVRSGSPQVPKPNTTCTTVSTATVTPTVIVDPPRCTDGGYYQVCSNGFKGCCKSDVCGSDKPYCPEKPVSNPPNCSPHCSVTTTVTSTTTYGTSTPTPSCKSCDEPTTTDCSNGTGAYYVCANNGFRGRCSVDPCASAWCPDFTKDTCTPKTPAPQTGFCPEGTGFYQVCSNGFRGCCTVDACVGHSPVCPACAS